MPNKPENNLAERVSISGVKLSPHTNANESRL